MNAETPAIASPSRHPLVIGALEAVRLLLWVCGLGLLGGVAMWLIGISRQQPLIAALGWAGDVIGAAHGLEIRLGDTVFGLAPTLASVLVVIALARACTRVRIALEANAVLAAAARMAPHPHAAGTALAALALVYLGAVGVVAFALGSAAPTPLGIARPIVLLALAVVISARGSRTAAPDHGWSTAVSAWFDARLGEEWSAALARGRALIVRICLGLLALAVLAAVVGHVLRRSAVAEVVAAYSNPVAAGVGLGAVSLAFAPTLLVFALAWLSGGGIDLGGSMSASALAGPDGAIIAVPSLAVVAGDPPAWAAAAPALLVLVGTVAAVGTRSWREDVDARSLTAAAVGLVALVGCAWMLCRGPVGPGGLDGFGVSWAAALLLAALPVAGAAAGWGLRLLAERGVSPASAASVR